MKGKKVFFHQDSLPCQRSKKTLAKFTTFGVASVAHCIRQIWLPASIISKQMKDRRAHKCSVLPDFLNIYDIKRIHTLNSVSPTSLGTWVSAIFVSITRSNSLSSSASIIEENPCTTALQWAWYCLFADKSFFGTSLNENSLRYAGYLSNNLKIIESYNKLDLSHF